MKSAVSLDGEFDQLASVVDEMANHDRKKAYAAWLTAQGDPRGEYLASIVDVWIKGNDLECVSSRFDAVWQKMCGISLLRSIDEVGLRSHATAICASSRPSLLLAPSDATNPVTIGASKFGGHPDLPEAVAWPELDGGLMTFVGQIRLEDVRYTQAGRELPKTGMLSFFVADESATSGLVGRGAELGASAILHVRDLSRLSRREPTKAFLAEGSVAPEAVIAMRETLDIPYCDFMFLDNPKTDFIDAVKRSKSLGFTKSHRDAYERLSESQQHEMGTGHPEPVSKLCGWAHPECVADDPVGYASRVVLTVASEELLSWNWVDGHRIYFSVSGDDFAAHQYGRCRVSDG